MKLLVHLTDDCNLNCSFCNRKDDPKRKEIDTLPIIKALNKVEQITDIQLSGGEPLLVKEKLYYFINELKDIVPLRILTNGYFIDEKFVEIVNNYNINVRVSLNGVETGEKNLKELIKYNPDAIALLKNIKNLNVRQVVNIKSNFVNSTIALLKTFNCNLELGFDYYSLNPKDIGAVEIFSFIEQIDRIKQFDSELIKRIKFINFPRKDCDCSDNYVLYIDGTLERFNERFEIQTGQKGCALISSLMGGENYNTLSKLIDLYRG